ncbi:hypothetical protein [Chondrinema litorale]|uniref:hypothetical protein n=1 Tax=Chondrinema litorale TaxID=2994555 RepID=UPI0025430844|nr:hypothetical protein [Chondrinema litorale]UZS00238.1 hypothetical protein OQ292_40570 [Chondrinema litorale]
MPKTKEILDKIEKILEPIKQYDQFKYLFSEDKGEEILVNLISEIKSLRFMVLSTDIKDIAFPKERPVRDGWTGKAGTLVKVRPCADEYGDKTFIGFLIGEAALSSELEIKEDVIQLNHSQYNPAILVPEINKVIYGCESWWGKIKSVEELEEITDKDIDNVWYVKLLKKQLEDKEKEKEESN